MTQNKTQQIAPMSTQIFPVTGDHHVLIESGAQDHKLQTMNDKQHPARDLSILVSERDDPKNVPLNITKAKGLV